MCRMIAAVGRFEAASVLRALSRMAENANAGYDHELRSLGDGLRHDSGWGVVYSAAGGLVRQRDTAPCFEDGAFAELFRIETGLMVAHARRTKVPATIALENTHPFMETFGGVGYAFCHNGEVSDRSQLSWDPSLSPRGSIDSEELFLHTITRIDPRDAAASVEEALGGLRGFTSLNCLLVSVRSVVAYARRDASTARPLYYTLWRGSRPGLEVVSSEVVEGLGVEWRPVPDGTAEEILADRCPATPDC